MEMLSPLTIPFLINVQIAASIARILLWFKPLHYPRPPPTMEAFLGDSDGWSKEAPWQPSLMFHFLHDHQRDQRECTWHLDQGPSAYKWPDPRWSYSCQHWQPDNDKLLDSLLQELTSDLSISSWPGQRGWSGGTHHYPLVGAGDGLQGVGWEAAQ